MTILPPAGEFPTGRRNDFEAALNDGIAAAEKAAAEKAAADNPEPQPGLADIMQSLQDILVSSDEPAPETKPGEKPTEKPAETPPAEENASRAEIDKLMVALKDEPEAIQAAVKRALEAGVDAQEAVAAVLQERDSVIAHAQLVSEVNELAKKYPSFDKKQLQTTLDHLSKLPRPLADELSLEEVARRAIGEDALQKAKEPPKPPAPKPAPTTGAVLRPGSRLPAVAEIVGDATPGSMGDDKPFDPGKGNNFNDLASFIVKKHGDSLMLPRK